MNIHKARMLRFVTIRGGFSELGPQANIGMRPYTFAHIYLNLEVPFLS